MSNTLTPKQAKFVEEYMIDLNATQAAIRTGYSESTAKSIGHENLTKPDVQEAISSARKKLAEKTGISQERVLKEYARLAFVDIRKTFDQNGNLIPIHELDDDTAAAIAGLEVEKRFSSFSEDEGKPLAESRTHKIKLADKKAALDSIARHLGMFVDKTELSGPNGGPIVTQTKEQRDAAVAAALAADS